MAGGMRMTRSETIEAALNAGTEAAYEKVGSQFDITNDAYRGAYIRRIREAMAAKLIDWPNLGVYTDTHMDRFEDIAQEDGFAIGVFDRSSRAVADAVFIRFEHVDFVMGDSTQALAV